MPRAKSRKSTLAPAKTSGRTELIPTLLVVAVALAACAAGLTNRFTQDDISIIHDSTRLHGFSELHDILTLPYWPPPAVPDLYRPVTSLLLAFQYVIGNGAPIVFRIVSYILYAAVSVGVFRLAAFLCGQTIGVGVGLLFAAHPLHVEAVALGVAQNELLVAALTVVAVTRYVERRRTGGLTGADWTLLVFLYFVAALAKEQGLVMPAFLAIAEIFLVPHDGVRARVAKVGRGFVALVIVGALIVVARTAVLRGAVAASLIADALTNKTLLGRAVTMLGIVPQWLRLFAWPAHLRADYSPKEFVGATSVGLSAIAGTVLVVAACVGVWWARRRAPVVAFGLAWCAVALFPVSNVLVPTGILTAERTLFLPSVGFLVAVGGAAGYLGRNITLSLPARRAAIAVVGALVVLGVVRSDLRQRVWHDAPALTVASVGDSPRSWRVQMSYGELMYDEHRAQDGAAAFQKAIEFSPHSWVARDWFAQRLRLVGDDAAALDQLHLSLRDNPTQVEALAALPPTLIALGRYEDAQRLCDSIIAVAGEPPVILWFRHVADSAIAVKAPPGSIRIGVRQLGPLDPMR